MTMLSLDRSTLLAAAAMLFPAAAAAQAPEARVLTPAHSPPARSQHAMALDEARGWIIVFGGSSQGTLLDDTWRWDGTDWAEVSSAVRPTARARAAMAWDAASQSLLMFGGDDGNAALTDTWSFGAAGWQQLFPTLSPAAGSIRVMAHDRSSDRTYLFVNSSTDVQAWRWLGTSWIPVFSPTQPSIFPTLAVYSDTESGIVALGHYVIIGQAWLFRNDAWTRLPYDPSSPHNWALAFDRRRNTLVSGQQVPLQFGTVSRILDLERGSWVQRNGQFSIGPAVWDPNRQTVIGFGGPATSGKSTESNTTYELGWLHHPGTATPYGNGCPAASPLQIASSDTPTIAETFDLDLSNVPTDTTLAAVALGLSRDRIGAFALPLPLDFFQMPGCFMLQSMEEPGIPVTLSPPTATAQIPIPNLVELVRVQVYLQGTVLARSVNANGVATSNGLEARIGN